jgi:hypothetical protein
MLSSVAMTACGVIQNKSNAIAERTGKDANTHKGVHTCLPGRQEMSPSWW